MIYCLYYLFIIKKKNKFRRENKRKKKTCNQISSIHSSKAKSSRWIQGQEHKNGPLLIITEAGLQKQYWKQSWKSIHWWSRCRNAEEPSSWEKSEVKHIRKLMISKTTSLHPSQSAVQMQFLKRLHFMLPKIYFLERCCRVQSIPVSQEDSPNYVFPLKKSSRQDREQN